MPGTQTALVPLTTYVTSGTAFQPPGNSDSNSVRWTVPLREAAARTVQRVRRRSVPEGRPGHGEPEPCPEPSTRRALKQRPWRQSSPRKPQRPHALPRVKAATNPTARSAWLAIP